MRYDKALMTELRKQGFKRTWESRGQYSEVVVYEKIAGDRKLEAQMFGDGGHRVSHWHTAKTLHGCMCTTPTDFSTVEELRAAIQHELTRTDHKPVRPLKKGTMIMGPGGVAIL